MDELYQMPFSQLEEAYNDHDCHLSREDGCLLCQAYRARLSENTDEDEKIDEYKLGNLLVV